MALYQKDSAYIILETGEDGYVATYILFDDISPPESKGQLLKLIDSANNAGKFPANKLVIQKRISADKTNLKTEINSFVDTIFDQ